MLLQILTLPILTRQEATEDSYCLRSYFKAVTMMRLGLCVFVIVSLSFTKNADGTKESFKFKGTGGNGKLQIANFNVLKGKEVIQSAIYGEKQKEVSNWFECYKHCLELAEDCRSFNYQKISSSIVCQPSGVMPHLQADKITSSAYEIWYMPYPPGSGNIA